MDVRKVDNSYRVSIGYENLRQLGWRPGDIIKEYVENNKVILVKNKNESELNLVHTETKEEILERVSREAEEALKFNVPGQKRGRPKSTKIAAIENSIIIKINKNPIQDRCHRCLNKLNRFEV